MAEFPSGIYDPRIKENKADVVYTPAKKTVSFVEDITKLDDEVVAIENFLLPQYIFCHTNDTIAVATGGTFQDIPFGDEVGDPKTGIEHDYTTDPEEFTITKAGVYLLNLACSFSDSAVSPNSHVVVRIVKNGSEIEGSLLEKDISGTPQSDKDMTLTNIVLATLAINDVIKFQFTADDTTVSLDSHATYGDHKDTAIVSILKVG